MKEQMYTVCQCDAALVEDVRCRCLERQLRTMNICGACKKGSHVGPDGVRRTMREFSKVLVEA